MFCPYCGEDLPDKAKSCTRCGSALAAGAKAKSLEQLDAERDLGAVEELELEPAPKKKVPTVECPNCGAEQPANKHRCGECGQALEMLAGDDVVRAKQALKLKIYGAVGVVGVILIVVFAVLMGKSRPALPEKRDKTSKQADALHQALTAEGLDDARKKSEWERVVGKYVTWSGKVLDVSGHTLIVDLGAKAPIPCRVGIDDRRTKEIKAKIGDQVAFLARLKSWGEGGDTYFFDLDDGEIE